MGWVRLRLLPDASVPSWRRTLQIARCRFDLESGTRPRLLAAADKNEHSLVHPVSRQCSSTSTPGGSKNSTVLQHRTTDQLKVSSRSIALAPQMCMSHNNPSKRCFIKQAKEWTNKQRRWRWCDWIYKQTERPRPHESGCGRENAEAKKLLKCNAKKI